MVFRGTYNKFRTQSIETSAEIRTYFKPEHKADEVVITFAKPYRDTLGRTKVQYKIGSDKTIHVTPRHLCAWLDDQDVLFARAEIRNWKDRVNESVGSYGLVYPEFFKKHQDEFIRFVGRTARASTVDNYYSALGRYVFPFFVSKLHENNVSKWADHYPAFRSFVLEAAGISFTNSVLTALRRYLGFLEYKGIYKQLHAPKNEKARRDRKEGKVLPGELPSWEDVASYISRLNPGYFRWLLTLCIAFGIRISEAMMVEEAHLLGKEEMESMSKNNDFLNRVNSKYKPVAFLSVDGAEKRDLVNKEVARILGEPTDDPKTGPYTAACISKEMGLLVVEMLANGEHEKPEGFDKIKACAMIQEMAVDNSAFQFDKWRFHDGRRFHITMLALEWGEFWDVAQAHGHASVETTKRYYQWGLVQRRKKKSGKFALNL